MKSHRLNDGGCEAPIEGAQKIKMCGTIWRNGRLAQNVGLGREGDREGATVKDIKLVNSLALTSSLIGSGFTIVMLCYSGFLPFFS